MNGACQIRCTYDTARYNCQTCPLTGSQPNEQIATWAWFDMLVDSVRYGSASETSNEEASDLLKGACAQAGVELTRKEYRTNYLAMRSLISCFRRRQTGACALATDSRRGTTNGTTK